VVCAALLAVVLAGGVVLAGINTIAAETWPEW
jgi:hypothetical protein